MNMAPFSLAAALVSVLVAISTVQASNTTEYDFIVVGGGTAGLAVASRLSQYLPNNTVLVIEAGPDGRNVPGIYIPGMKGSTLGGVYDYNFTTVAQTHAGGRSWAQNRGKVLGGSSALNLMCWDRASVAEYDAWEHIGNPGWNWDSMITNMLKVENYTQSVYPGQGINQGVGVDGPIHATINRIQPDDQNTWIPTMEKLGFLENMESLDGNPLGVSIQPNNIDTAKYTRSYSPEYLKIARDNLHVMTEAQVIKVNTEKRNGKIVATGVTLKGNLTINACKEVILSAGSFQSPGLLELSGIGNSSIITAAGIEPVLELPTVGENLQDHIRIQNSFKLKNMTSFDVLKYNPAYKAEQLTLYNANNESLYDYAASGFAYLTWPQALGNESASLVNVAKIATNVNASIIDKTKIDFMTGNKSHTIPQLEIIFSDGYTGVGGYPVVNSSEYGSNYFTLLSVIMHTMSRGHVHINASDPLSKPIIDPRYFSNEYDLQAAIAATKLNRKIAQTAPMKDIIAEEYEPSAEIQTDEQWRNFALNHTLTIYHPLGTCAMLPKKDGGVVNPELKVYGTSNLRVVDASIIPVQLSAHIQTAIYGIAERAAEMIAAEWSA
ncbi:alcohol oxidase [Aureobasidium subglaciale]|nr:alcohol oxidase [Aureobasidium subglaciale]KAI5215592.1 alcohol oxidase [Aureobasidium subglaciale]KAI5218810.1 alcohol oxidase [Aureobasidium subglaciale]KAI5256483.1 alcohol oxidase [Aureobasidium subglaciale]